MADTQVVRVQLADGDYFTMGGWTFQREGNSLVTPMHPVQAPGKRVLEVIVEFEGPNDPEKDWS